MYHHIYKRIYISFKVHNKMSKRKDFCNLSARQQRRRIVNLTNVNLLNKSNVNMNVNTNFDNVNMNVNTNVNTNFDNAAFMFNPKINNSDIEYKSKSTTYENDNGNFETINDMHIESDKNFAVKIQQIPTNNITYDLRSWILKYNISHAAANNLLQIFEKT